MIKKLYVSIVAILLVCLFSAVTFDRETSITIFMIGDSTMADKDLKNGNIERGWGQMLPELLSESITVKNYAVNGRSSLSFITEGRWNEVLSQLKNGDYVFIQFGHNDEKKDSALHTVPGGTFDENLCRFVRETRAKGAVPVLFNSIVRRNYPPAGMKEHHYTYETEGDILVDTHGEYREVPRRVARKMKVPFVDANQLTRELVERMGPEESKRLFMWVPAHKYAFCPEGKVDNTHLNVEGATVVASLLIKKTIEVIPQLADFLRQEEVDNILKKYPLSEDIR